tara:strand:+ start:720 stop:1298 length:579 start_codon:yes stop_codon:yes gene_type:complete
MSTYLINKTKITVNHTLVLYLNQQLKIIIMKYIFILALVIFASCKTVDNVKSENGKTNNEQTNSEGGIVERKYEPIEIKAEIGRIEREQTTSVQIIKSRIEGNTLFLKIGYSGGCEKHNFKVIGNPMISKSLPPIRSIELVHLNSGDTCREYIEQQLIIDISDLAYEKENGSKIKLQFSGIEEMLMFTYTSE